MKSVIVKIYEDNSAFIEVESNALYNELVEFRKKHPEMDDKESFKALKTQVFVEGAKILHDFIHSAVETEGAYKLGLNMYGYKVDIETEKLQIEPIKINEELKEYYQSRNSEK